MQTTPKSRTLHSRDRPKLAWLHVPKAGQSFLTALALYGCGDNRTESRLISVSASETMLRLHAEGARQVAHKTSRLLGMTSSQRCPRLLQEFTTGHAGARKVDPSAGTALAGFMREPRQRLLSYCASHYDLRSKDFPRCVEVTVRNNHLGVTVHQLVGTAVSNAMAPLPPLTPEDVGVALRRLVRDVAFVGLTSEWQASIELFHAQFMPEQPVLREELGNIHPSRGGRRREDNKSSHALKAPMADACSRGYDEGVLNRLPSSLQERLRFDPDQLLHAVASWRFCDAWRRELAHRALPKHCSHPCPIFGDDGSERGQARNAEQLLEQWRVPAEVRLWVMPLLVRT